MELADHHEQAIGIAGATGGAALPGQNAGPDDPLLRRKGKIPDQSMFPGGEPKDPATGHAPVRRPSFFGPVPVDESRPLLATARKQIWTNNDLAQSEKDGMLADIGAFQDSLEGIRDECVDILVTKGLFREPNAKQDQQTYNRGATRISQDAIVAEWQHLEGSTVGKAKARVGTLETLRKMIYDAQQLSKGQLTQGPTNAIARTYQAYLDNSGGPASIKGWKKDGFKKAEGPAGGPTQPVPKAWVDGGKDTSSLVQDYELDASTDRKMVTDFLKNVKREEYGPVSETANPDLFQVVKARGGLDNGSSPFYYVNYMWARAASTKESFETWVTRTLRFHEGHALIKSPVKSLSKIRGDPSKTDDWLTITVNCTSLDFLASAFLLIRKELDGLAGKASTAAVDRSGGEDLDAVVYSDSYIGMVAVKQNVDKLKHEVLMLVNFEGMLCKIEFQLEKILALKEILRVPGTLASRKPETSPLIDELVEVEKVIMHAETIKPEHVTLTATYM